MKIIKISIFVVAAAITASACKKDSLGNVDNVSGLGGDTATKTAIDQWLYDTLTVPFNVAVKYKWDQSELELNKTLVPVSEEKVIPLFSSIKKVWIDNYVGEAGLMFMKKYIPKFFVVAGSANFNPDGTIVLGVAEGGRKILLYQVNDFRVKGMPGYMSSDSFNVKQMFHTIEHEFGHILHQTVLYTPDYKKISVGSYTSSWNNMSNAQAHDLGFVTPYAMSAPDEDFVEMISTMLVEGAGGFDAIVNSASAAGQAKLRQKQAIVISYFKDVWNINFSSLQSRTRNTIASLIQ